MAKILVLFAHPALEKSRVHSRMLYHIRKLKDLTINDLYEEYPDFDVDVEREQRLLLQHDVIIWQHPFYWYSAPALLKQWIDLVLEHGWAYGATGNALRGKKIFNALSLGGSKYAYDQTGLNRIPIRQYLAPFEQTARLCKMQYLAPYIIDGTHKLTNETIEVLAHQYAGLIKRIQENLLTSVPIENVLYLNDLLGDVQTHQTL
ncbi:NAD(P)H oxidoreductase [Segetibacter sp. 3557_3]|uniref:glutathione-regulated potassium-efflux system oxidoreductase KefF n=1 Tax=Segetibacter sp. 3557_3 TaxID=2547429 RepID=UPI00105879BB|nr:NAD(P)H-dependent oxidoreductase [Segetibacter sp. 3557_3]TDH27402.1 NAD(P)H oxidoreductase [Segetibacter sp. 3557_3]